MSNPRIPLLFFLNICILRIISANSNLPKHFNTLIHTPQFIPTLPRTSQRLHPLFATSNTHEDVSELDKKLSLFSKAKNSEKQILRLPQPPPLVQNGTLTLTGQIVAGALSRSIANTALHPISYSKALGKQDNLITELSLTKLFEQSQYWWNGAGAHFLTSLPFGVMAILISKSSRNLLGVIIPWTYAKPFLEYSSQTFSAIFSTFLSAPQAALINNIISGNSTNLLESFSTILNKKGWGGFYEGFQASLVKRIPTMLLSIAISQQLKSALSLIPLNKNVSSGLKTVVIGLLASSITSSLISPYETLKSKVESEMNQDPKPRYKSTWGALKEQLENNTYSELLSNIPSKLSTTLPPLGLQTSLFEIIKFALIRRSLNKNIQIDANTNKKKKDFTYHSPNKTQSI